jgi:hypothetical protein
MAATPLLGLSLPADGTTNWGTLVNTSITALLDSAVAGTTTITVDDNTILSDTTEAANDSRQAIILWKPLTGTVTRTITAPARSKTYVVINATGGTQSIVFRGTGPTTGVTIPAGRAYMLAWNGSDFVATGVTTVNLATDVTGTLSVSNGGTGQTTQQAAINALAGAVTSGQYLRGNGTNVVMSTIQAADVPTLNQNTTGTAGGLSVTLPISNGGTNSTATPTAGGAAYGTGTAYAVTAAGTSGQVLTSNGAAAPTWETPTSAGVSSISFGSIGLTPSTATTGAVTVAGTLGVANGGTGLNTYNANGVLYASGATTLAAGTAFTYDPTTNILTNNKAASVYNWASSYSQYSSGSFTVASSTAGAVTFLTNNLIDTGGGIYRLGPSNSYGGALLMQNGGFIFYSSLTSGTGQPIVSIASLLFADRLGNFQFNSSTYPGSVIFYGSIKSATISILSAATIQPTSNTTNQYNVTALATSAIFAAPTGSPADGQRLLIRIKDDGTARGLTWSASYREIGTTLPTTTVATKTTYVDCIYNSADIKWDVVDVKQQV